MSQGTTTILGGSLGAGKTTLLENLIENNSFSQRPSGIVIMDAAGQVDFDRIKRVGENKGVRVLNATAACAVCGGPSTAKRMYQELKKQGVEDVVIELSGRVAIPSMQNKLLGINDDSHIRTAYLLDPQTMKLVGAAGELPFAQVVGVTKNAADQGLLRQYAPNAKILDVAKDYSGTLDELFSGAPQELFEGEFRRPHSHKGDPDLTTQFFGNIENPYLGFAELMDRVKALGIYRAKGHLAFDSSRVIQFNVTNGVLEESMVEDPHASNGVIMLASPLEEKFSRKGVENMLSSFIEKPDVPPVMRIYSPQEEVDEYVSHALSAGNYDEALGAAEQFQFESEKDKFVRSVMPEFVRGKKELIEATTDISSRALQGLALVYALHTHKQITPELENDRLRASSQYLDDLSGLKESDWEVIRSDNPSTAEYMNKVAGWARQYQA